MRTLAESPVGSSSWTILETSQPSRVCMAYGFLPAVETVQFRVAMVSCQSIVLWPWDEGICYFANRDQPTAPLWNCSLSAGLQTRLATPTSSTDVGQTTVHSHTLFSQSENATTIVKCRVQAPCNA